MNKLLPFISKSLGPSWLDKYQDDKEYAQGGTYGTPLSPRILNLPPSYQMNYANGGNTQNILPPVSHEDSVRHQAIKTFNYEEMHGSPTGTGLPDYGYHSSQLPFDQLSQNWVKPKTKEQAGDLYMKEIYPRLGNFQTAMEKGEAGDFLYNTGRDPRVYMLDQYLKSIGKPGIPNRGSYNVDTKSEKWTPDLQQSLDQQWNQYIPDINKLSVNQRRQLLNKGRDFYYKNTYTGKPGEGEGVTNWGFDADGKPKVGPDGSLSPAYGKTWKPRIWEAVNTYKTGGPIIDPRGQWAHPGKVTRIPSPSITMQGVGYPVLGKANNGKTIMMQPGQDYHFGNATYVDEYPMMQKGGTLPPYITNNPNDPRLRAYSDSLNAYENGERNYNWVKTNIYDAIRSNKNVDFRNSHTYVNHSNSGKPTPYPGDAGNIYPISTYAEKWEKKPQGMFSKIFNSSSDNWVGNDGEQYENTGVAWSRFKKPEQEVILQQRNKQQPKVQQTNLLIPKPKTFDELHPKQTLGQQQPLTAEQVGLVHPQDFQPKMINPAMVNTTPNIQPVGNKPPTPTNYVATWRDENLPDKTGKKYFQNKKDWTEFTQNNPDYNFRDTSETADGATSSGYLQRKQKGGWLDYYN